tara:strand:- start:879 stop:2828 length:1950 start_codon:yes stop_codon:yes gene_type:complete
MQSYEEYYEKILFIRKFEESLLSYFKGGMLRGTTHTSIGQEVVPVSAMEFVTNQDYIFSNHRGHGHFLSYGGDPLKLFLELRGHHEGIARGIGGSQHLHYNNFYSNGILGSTVPIAAGVAYALKINKSNGISICFLGDGAFGEGVIYESLNMASIWNLPILFIIEKNNVAQSTPTEITTAGSLKDRFKAFSIKSKHIETKNFNDVYNSFEKAFHYVRTNNKPFSIIAEVPRLGPHSKGDDIRSTKELNKIKADDPLLFFDSVIKEKDIISINKKVSSDLEKYINKTNEIIKSVNPIYEHLVKINHDTIFNDNILCNRKLKVVEYLNEVLREIMSSNKKVMIFGEDLSDPYGGAFKVTRGLQESFPENVISTPISEAGFTGLAAGFSLKGETAIVEIMFGDFTTLIMDQLVNNISKIPEMYGDKISLSIIIRTPMGGYRGYGPTHSQTLDKFLIGIPNITVIAMNQIMNWQELWSRMVEKKSPFILIENKSLYGQNMFCKNDHGKINNFDIRITNTEFPSAYLSLFNFKENSDAIIITYGGMLKLAMDFAIKMFREKELNIEIFLMTQLSPVSKIELDYIINKGNFFVTLEEGSKSFGWGSEICTQLHELKKGIVTKRCAAYDGVIPSSEIGENTVLPNIKSLESLFNYV